jgi:hypothetical protein
MQFLKEHYEKIALGFSVALLSVFVAMYFLADSTVKQSSIVAITTEQFLISLRTLDSNATRAQFETRNPHGLMPGDKIEFGGDGASLDTESYLVTEVLPPDDYQETMIIRRDGMEVTGFFRAIQGRVLLGSARFNITLEVDGSDVTISGDEIARIVGSRKANFRSLTNSSLANLSEDSSLVVYQRRHIDRVFSQAPPWGPPVIGEDNVSYDLFTPPKIFFKEGKLTTEAPKGDEVMKPKVPFGIQLLSFERVPYRFYVTGWVNPEDPSPNLVLKRAQGRDINTNVKIGQFYKKGTREQGFKMQPTTESDTEKTIKVIDFKISSFQVENGGTRDMGILKLLDYALGASPREVVIEVVPTLGKNQKPVSAGELTIKVSSTLPETVGENHTLTENSTGEKFLIGGAEYHVLKIDPSIQSLLLEKRSSNSEESDQQLLRMAPSPSP